MGLCGDFIVTKRRADEGYLQILEERWRKRGADSMAKLFMVSSCRTWVDDVPQTRDGLVGLVGIVEK